MSNATDRLAERHAHALLMRLGYSERPAAVHDHPALAWRRAGLMKVTGQPDGPGLVAPVALASAADGALAALKALAPDARLPENGALLLGERARLLGLRRRGAVSANGSCRLLETLNGHVALNLPRFDDWDLMPALLGQPAADWAEVATAAKRWKRNILVAQGRQLGLAIAVDQAARSALPFRLEVFDHKEPRRGVPLVVDLSSLWAGPLTGSLLRAAGARVIKIESSRRPDGARGGDAGFFDLLNAGKESVALDFSDPRDSERLRRVIDHADIVIEGSRPRALAQLGIRAQEVAARGATWLSITAHGRLGEAADWIGFGDDAAVAGGLTSEMARGWGEPLFAGDAIADPLTGITAALAGWAGWLQGGGRLISLALADVVADACLLYQAQRVDRWQALADADVMPLYPLRIPAGATHVLGADTDAVLAEFSAR